MITKSHDKKLTEIYFVLVSKIIYNLSFNMLLTFSPNSLAPAKLSAADGNNLHFSNHVAILGYLFKSPPSSCF